MNDADDIVLLGSEVMDSTGTSFQAIFSDQYSPRHTNRKHD